jgi:hypothetical protein
MALVCTYSAVLIALYCLLLTAAKATFVNKLGELLFHQFLNLGNSFLETFLASAGNVQVQGGILSYRLAAASSPVHANIHHLPRL